MLSSDSYDNIHVFTPIANDGVDTTEKRAALTPPLTPESAPRQQSDLEGLVPGKAGLLHSVSWQKWYAAFKNILPVYIALHLALFAISCLAFLFITKDFSGQTWPVATLWKQWRHWDSNFYLEIATQGYKTLQHMAFFPLYPLLIRGLSFITQNPLISGLLISNAAELVMFTVLYRLVEEEFDGNRAYYTVLYFAIFPSAFFFSAVYTESLFLCFSTLTLYQLRRGRWGFAALFAGLASFTRPDGMFLLVPFCYEYFYRLWQRQEQSPRALFSWKQISGLVKKIRWNILFGLCFPAGVALVIAYGYYQFHDPLAFVHAHKYWTRAMRFPGWGILETMWVILHHGLLNFLTIRSSIDLGTDLFILVMIVLCFIGPWKLPTNMWGYALYALTLYTYFQLFPVANQYPLESMSRFLLEIFPAFMLLSRLSKYRTFSLSYCMVSGALFFFLLTQFLTGRWIT